MPPKLIRTSTVPLSLNLLLKGQLRFLSAHFEVVAVSSSGEDLAVVQNREGVRTETVEMERKISPVKDVISLYQLIQLFRKEKPHIVHSITPKAGLLSMLAAKIAGVPYRVHTFTGLIFPHTTGWKQQLLIQTDRLLCRAATHIIPEGEGVKRDLQKYKITNKPLHILANGSVNGIDLQEWNPENVVREEQGKLRTSMEIQPVDFVFVFVGRMVPDKGIEELIAAFDAVSQKNEKCKLLLVGPAEKESQQLKPETLHQIKSHPKIRWVGFQADVRLYLSVADVLVFPSHREGFPNVPLQALAMGKPVIATNIGGCNEIVHSKNGILIPKKNSEELQKAMEEIQKPEIFTALKSQTISSVQKWNSADLWKSLLHFYQQFE